MAWLIAGIAAIPSAIFWQKIGNLTSIDTSLLLSSFLSISKIVDLTLNKAKICSINNVDEILQEDKVAKNEFFAIFGSPKKHEIFRCLVKVK